MLYHSRIRRPRRLSMFDLDFDLSDNDLRKILKNSQVIAMVGASDDHYYSSYQVLQYLLHVG